MSPRVLALYLFVAMSFGARAQDGPLATKQLEITEVAVSPYAAEFQIKGAPTGVAFKWTVEPMPPGFFKRPINQHDRVIVAGPPGTYTLTAEVSQASIGPIPKDWKEGTKVPLTIEAVTYSRTFTLTGGVAPGPLPPPVPPGPIPPAPLSALETEIRAAAPAWAANEFARLAIAIRRAAAHATEGAAVSDVIAAMQGTIREISPRIPTALQTVLGREVNSALPRAGNLTADQINKASVLFESLARSLDNVAARSSR